MEIFENWILDFLFYGFLDSIIMYLFVIKIFLNKKVKFIEAVKDGLILSFGISTITTFVPINGLSQIFMGIYIGIFTSIRFKINIFKTILYGMVSILFVYAIEILCVRSFNVIFNINVLTYNLNNIMRLSLFMTFEFIESFIIWSLYKMKVLLGGIVRR